MALQVFDSNYNGYSTDELYFFVRPYLIHKFSSAH